MTGLLNRIGGWLGDDTNRMRLAGASHILGALDQGQAPNVAPFLGAIQEQQDAQAFRDSLGSEDMMGRFSDEERSFLAGLPPQVAQKFIAERIFAQPEPTTYGWQTMPDGTLVRTDSTGGITPMGSFGKPAESYRTISGAEAAALGLDPAQAYNIGPDNKISQIGGGGTNVNVNMGDGAPGLGKLSADYGYVLDPETRQPLIDPATGLPTAAPVPGSPAAQGIADAERMREDQSGQAERYGKIVLEDIGRVLEAVEKNPSLVAGPMGTMLSNLPGTGAHDVSAMLGTIRANVGFDRLQAMRAASPTGGALGAVSDGENRMLQATLGALEQSQSPAQFAQNLRRLQNLYTEIVHGPAPAGVSDDDWSAQAWGGGQPAQPAPQSNRRRYNPATGEFE